MVLGPGHQSALSRSNMKTAAKAVAVLVLAAVAAAAPFLDYAGEDQESDAVVKLIEGKRE